MMKIGAKGLALVKRWEGLKLKAYLCPAKVWTIGYGSTGAHVKPCMVISEADAEKLLLDDLERFERAVSGACPNATQNQFDAMVALAFNIGIGGFGKSSVCRFHNTGQHEKAAASFAPWNKAGGKVLKGLVNRRADEAALYRGVA